jgi:hypothetical protein
MKLGKKPVTKNLVYSNYDLTDEDHFDYAPIHTKKPEKQVKKMKDRYDQVSGSKERRGFM